MTDKIQPAPETKHEEKQLEEKFSGELTANPDPHDAELHPENPEDSDATKAVGDHDAIAAAMREADPER